MGKKKLELEYELKSNAANIIWAIISTDSGLNKWLADEVTSGKDTMTFVWGDPDGNHERRTAIIQSMVKNSHIRMQWEDEQDPNAYLEIRMCKSDLTNDYHLTITDFAWEEDVESLHDIWDQNFEVLHRNTGL